MLQASSNQFERCIEAKMSQILRKTRHVFFFQHNNDHPHVAKPLKETLEALLCDLLPYPLYSPDVSPLDYFFSQKSKTVLMI